MFIFRLFTKILQILANVSHCTKLSNLLRLVRLRCPRIAYNEQGIGAVRATLLLNNIHLLRPHCAKPELGVRHFFFYNLLNFRKMHITSCFCRKRKRIAKTFNCQQITI